MRIAKQSLLEAFPRKIINIHPSLLPKFPGLEAWKQALAAGETVTGCTVHYVEAGVDTGEILGKEPCSILPDDTPERLHVRIQKAEHVLLPAVVADIAARFRGPELYVKRRLNVACSTPLLPPEAGRLASATRSAKSGLFPCVFTAGVSILGSYEENRGDH